MAAAEPLRVSLADYRRAERESPIKHEYWGGVVYAMTGGSGTHARLGARMISLLDRLLESTPCAVYSGDLRIRVESGNMSLYPDGSVVCGPLEHPPEDLYEVRNPTIVVEVTSPSSERDDRGRKSRAYRSLSTLRDYLIVSQDEKWIEHHRYVRPGVFEVRSLGAGDVIELAGVSGTLSVDDVYRGVELADAEARA